MATFTNEEILAAVLSHFYEQGRRDDRLCTEQGKKTTRRTLDVPTEKELTAILESPPPYLSALLEYTDDLVPSIVAHHPRSLAESTADLVAGVERGKEMIRDTAMRALGLKEGGLVPQRRGRR